MNGFKVWLRPLGVRCRVRVNGVGNAEWLRKRLGESISVDETDPCPETLEPNVCSFEVPCHEPRSRHRLETLLASMPEVELMMRPE